MNRFRDTSSRPKSFSPQRLIPWQSSPLDDSQCREEIYQSLGILGSGHLVTPKPIDNPIVPYVKQKRRTNSESNELVSNLQPLGRQVQKVKQPGQKKKPLVLKRAEITINPPRDQILI